MIASMVKQAAGVRIGSLLLVALLVGIFTVRDYGESWDEADIYRYAEYSLGAYRYFFHPADLPQFETNLNLYGPGYFMAADLGAQLFSRVIPPWSPIDAQHFIYFVTFLGCGLCVYLLSRRWVSEAAALGATALLLTQPLLWGHAFINPKDIPFMALFAASILAGLMMIDHYAARRRLDLAIMPASILLGITATLRVVGPWAGVIVLGFGLYRLRKQVVSLAAAYLGVAAITAYVTWPYLWGSPIARFIQSAGTMADFPFSTLVLFEGHLYKAAQLPWSYFPTLLTLQLTEPLLALLPIAVAACIWLWPKRQYREPAALFVAWFLVPAILIVGFGSPLYDNGRQLYFLLPPLFVLAGVALEALFGFLARPWIQGAVVIAAVLPGLLLGVRLHPYEYVYYNVLTGGTGGAYREFEMDYLGTSLKELTARLNVVAARNARVLVFGPEQIVAAYARPDIQVALPRPDTGAGYDYVVVLTRENLDERRCKDAVTVDEIERRGAVFAVLKRIPAGVECK